MNFILPKELSDTVCNKVEKVGKVPVYLTPQQRLLIDNYSICTENGRFRRVLLNGKYGSGKTYTLLLGIEKLIKMLPNDENGKLPLIIFMSAKYGHRQNHSTHLNDAFNSFLRHLIDSNPSISFMFVDDSFDYKDSNDSGIIVKCGNEISAVQQTNENDNQPVVQGLKNFVRRIFKMKGIERDDNKEAAEEKSKKLDADKVEFEPQLLYNFQKKSDGTLRYKLEDYAIFLFADEVDRETVDWERITTSPTYNKMGMWLAMNAERFNDNKYLVRKFSDSFQEIRLDYILRNTKLVTKFVNDIRNGISAGSGNSTEPKPGHCIDGFLPRLLCLDFYDRERSLNNVPKYLHFVEDMNSTSLSTYMTFQKLPNAIVSCICDMFRLSETVSFLEMIDHMSEVCIVAQELINNFLINCFELLDVEETFRQKITFETTEGIIGREFAHVIYPAVSYMYLKDQGTNDVIYSEMLNVCSRPKGHLYLIDIGTKETEKVHQLECYSRFEVHDKIHGLSYEVFSDCQDTNMNKFRRDILPKVIENGSIATHGEKPDDVISNLRSSSALQKLELGRPRLRKSDLDLVVDGFYEFLQLQPSSLNISILPTLHAIGKFILGSSNL